VSVRGTRESGAQMQAVSLSLQRMLVSNKLH
jgi:hypothetical protein